MMSFSTVSLNKKTRSFEYKYDWTKNSTNENSTIQDANESPQYETYRNINIVDMDEESDSEEFHWTCLSKKNK